MIAALVAAMAFALIWGAAGRAVSQAPRAPAALVPAPTPKATPAPAAAAPAQPVHALTAVDLESWLDGMLPAALEQGKVAGVVVSVVKDGKPLLTRGYGYADVARKAPMDPDRTLVRPGSTSKLFTWTAVMQLVEQGKLDLDADVNRYLDFKIPEPYGRPITLTDLMTHRAGFEEGLKDALSNDPETFQSLDIYLKSHVRPVLFPPGEVPAYSNYGTALAGYIVQRVSGERYENYVARHIFQPLGMRHSTFYQPLPPHFPGAPSKGYRSSDAAPSPFELVTVGPAGGLSTTAADMAQFMLAHLGDGGTGGAQILRPETARLMHRASLAHLPGFDAMAHGFFLSEKNGRATLSHGGDTVVFHTDLTLMPEERTGIFFSFNSRGEGNSVYGMRERLTNGFFDRYFPAPAPVTLPAVATARAHGQEVAGRYESSRRVENGFISLFYVLQGQEVIALNPDGTIGFAGEPVKRFREIGPYLWREVGGTRELAVKQVGGVRTVIDSANPAGVLQPVPLKRNAGLNLFIFGVSLLILLAAAAAWPIAEGARRVYRQPPAVAGRLLWARRLARIAVVADLAYLFVWYELLSPILSTEVAFYTTGRDALIRAVQLAAIVPLAGAALGIWHAFLSLRSGRRWPIKLGGVLVALALIGVLWVAWVGGLTSFTLNY